MPPKAARHARSTTIAGIIFRSAFIVAFGLAALWSSFPADRSFAAIDHLSGVELVRIALGTAVCLGAFVQAFRLPKDEQAYKTWIYIGAACILTMLCVLAIRALQNR